MERIKSSVGQGGRNFPGDVAIVQALLNRHRTSSSPLLEEDKVAGGDTINAIKEFQTRVVKMPRPDGRIDPKGHTAEFLYTSPTMVTVQSTVAYLNALVASVQAAAKKITVSGLLPVNLFSQHNNIAWGAKVSPEFKAKVIKIAKNLDISPDFLMTCMAFETKETFRADKKNEAGSSGTGLIQFMKDTAVDLETTTEKLAAMSAVQQLDYVEKYFKGRIKTYKQLNTLEDVYFAILHPPGIGKKDDVVLFKEGTKEYMPNKGLDKNKDKEITVGEVAVTIRKMYAKGLQQGYLG
jgi:hypothetical protein